MRVSTGIFGTLSVVLEQCQDFGEARADAFDGDLGWQPAPLSEASWICDEIEIWNSPEQRWVDNGAGIPAGVRACNDVFE